jgi:hypothetical protein
MSETGKENYSQKNVLEFYTVANELCLFLEKSDEYRKEEIIEYWHKICPLIYLKGSLLPVISVTNPEANERYVTEEQWEYLFNTLREKLGKDDEFWFINERRFIDDEIDKGSLAEHFADIYQDLKDFLMLYRKESHDAKENAVQSCRMLFEMNWGMKLIRCMKAIHYYLHPDSFEEEDMGLEDIQ